MASPTLANELAPASGGFEILDFTTAGTIAGKWAGTLPEARSFIVQPIGGDLEWRADGTAATAGNGIKITDGSMQIFENQKAFLTAASFIGAATVRVHLFG